MSESGSSRIKPHPSPAVTSFPTPDRGPWEMTVAGELTDKQSDMVGRLTEVPPGSRGIIWFDSCGGSVYAGLALATIIRMRNLKVTGVVIGECSSAALMPFAACRQRFVTPYSTLLFHPMRWQSEEDIRLEEAAEWTRHFRHLEGRLDELLAQLFPMPADDLQKWTVPGRFVSGPELADAGLATMIDPFQQDDCWKTVRTA